jgi:hypothetical protein
MCTSVDIVWKSVGENFGFEARVLPLQLFCRFLRNFSLAFSCQKKFLDWRERHFTWTLAQLRMHERFSTERRPFEKENLDLTGLLDQDSAAANESIRRAS